MRRALLGTTGLCFTFMLGLLAEAADYYVNDAATNNDCWCAAPGADGNDGLTPGTPALRLQAVLDLYDLGGGDVVRVDTGTYPLPANVVIGAADSGSSTNDMLRILGSTNGTTMTRGSFGSSAYAFHFDQAAFVGLERLRIEGASQGVRIETAEHIEVADCEILNCQYGVVLAGGSGHVIEDSVIHDHSRKGILGSSSAGPRLARNAIYNVLDAATTSDHAIDLFACASAEIRGNTIRNNGGDGVHLASCPAAVVAENTVRSQGANGVDLYGCNAPVLDGNTIRQNADGVHVSHCPGLIFSNGRVYSNTGRGISLADGDARVEHNLVYANLGGGLVSSDAGSSVVRNNTFYRNAGANLALAGHYDYADIRNNILHSSGAGQRCLEMEEFENTWYSDYNVFHTTDGAAAWYWRGTRFLLASWQHYADRDRHSLALDPLFVDPDGPDNALGGINGDDDDFHLQSAVGSYHGGAWAPDGAMSPCIDAGDPASDFGAEPAVNGGRVDLGTYGNSDEASLSTSNRVLRLLYPNGGEIGFRRFRARWAATGPWLTNDSVKVQYSTDGGAAWADCEAANPLDYDNSLYGWDLRAVTPGTQILLRVVALTDTNVADASDAPFEVLDASPKILYVNDASTAGDQWCTAAGSAANTGMSGGSPLDSLDHVLEVYPEVGAGDEIRLDTGQHDSDRMIYITDANSGAAGSNLTIRGSGAGPAILDGLAAFDVVSLRRIDHVRLENLTIAGGANGICAEGTTNDPCDGVEIAGCTLAGNSSYGLYLKLCTNALVESNLCHTLGLVGIQANHHGVIRDNRSASNYLDGIRVSGAFLVRSNVCWRNGAAGIAADGVSHVEGNRCYGNRSAGMILQDGAAIGNTVFGNTNAGISLLSGADASRNVVYGNGADGIHAYGDSDVRNNLVFSNAAFNLWMQTDGGRIENNTLAGGNGLYLGSDPNSVTSVNNIIYCRGAGQTAIYISDPPYAPGGFVSDYNDVYVTDGAVAGFWYGPRATLEAWQAVTLLDAHSVAIDPRFADAPNADYHLRSPDGHYTGVPFSAPGGGTFTNDPELSFCVDAGDPAAAYVQESPDNGGRINLGAFGNTPDASRSPGERMSLVTAPEGGALWFGSREIRWLTRGPWDADTVSLEYSDDGGSTWHSITGGVDYAAGTCLWATGALTPGTNYLVRLWRDGGGATGVCNGAFAVLAAGPRTYYVNDTGTVNDVYCTAPGSDAADGLAPDTPKRTLQALLDTYDLEPGDTVRIDTGLYPLTATLIFTTNDIGAAGNPVRFVGSFHADGSVFARGATGQNVFQLGNGVHHVRLEQLRATGGARGFSVEGAWDNESRGVELVGCTAYSNASQGFYLSYGTNAVVWSNTACANASGGIYLLGTADVRYNVAWSNAAGIRLAGPGIVAGNTAWGNASYGIEVYGESGVPVEDNLSRDNGGDGIRASGYDSPVARNRVYGNRGHGLYLANGSRARWNVVYGNGDEGVFVTGPGQFDVRNNLIYANGTNYDTRFNVSIEAGSGLFVNNTVYGRNGVEIYDVYQITNRENIVWSSGTGCTALYVENLPLSYEVFESDFNDLLATDGAAVGYWSGRQDSLAEWQFASGRDRQSYARDPLFVDPDGLDNVLGGANGWDDNFHLQSEAGSYTGLPFTAATTAMFATNATTSWCIDSGHPGSSYADELDPDGGRINVGAFGNTADASLSPGTAAIALVVVRGGEVLRGVRRLKWVTRGPWVPGDLVRLEWTDDYKTYHFVADVPYGLGGYDWDTSGMPPSGFYALRASRVNDPAVCDVSGSFAIVPVSPMTFYVNDASTNNDEFCTASGAAANTGVTNSSPKLTLTALLMDFTLVPGDVVLVDAGTYTTRASTVFYDSGSVAQSILLQGATNGSVFVGPELAEPIFKFLGSDYWRVQLMAAARGQDHGFYVEGSATNYCEALEIRHCLAYSNANDGIHVMDRVTNTVISGGRFFANSDGIEFANAGSAQHGEVALATCDRNRNIGIRAAGAVTVVSNHCHLNGSHGIFSEGNRVLAERNRCHENSSSGITLTYGTARRNSVYLNGASGVTLYNSATSEQNVVWGNVSHGIVTVSAHPASPVIRNNLVYSNAAYGIRINQSALIENNTLYGGNGIYIDDVAAVTQRHNIVWSRGAGNAAVYLRLVPGGSDVWVSDFNDLVATDGAAIGFWRGRRTAMDDWRYATGQDRQSVSCDPLFVNPAGADGLLGGTNGWDDNFHLRSVAGSYTGQPFTATSPAQFAADPDTSPCVDAADPAASWTNELPPAGLRRNLGAFGNTADASLSPEARAVGLIAVTGGELLRGTVRLTWATTGPWATGDTVRLEWNGTNKTWDTIACVPYQLGYYDWDTTAWAPDHGQLRAARSNGMAQSHLTGAIDLYPPAGLTFYVNDRSASNDVYCSTIGDDANDGRTTNTPMATLESLVRAYNLVPGDCIYLDTGTWVMDATFLRYGDAGRVLDPIRYVGSTHAAGSLFNRNDTAWETFLLSDCDHIRMERLRITGGKVGIAAWGGSTNLCDGIQVTDCEIYGHAQHGIAMGYVTNAVIGSNRLHHQTYSGAAAANENHGVATDNECYNNGDDGMDLTGAFTVTRNHCHHNTGTGLTLGGTILAVSNTCHENQTGISINGALSEASDNVSYLNTYYGLSAGYGCDVRRNRIYSNGRHGLYYSYESGAPPVLANNLCYDNARSAVASYYNLYVANAVKSVVENNTLYGGHGLYLSSISSVTNRNNVIWTTQSGCYGVRVGSTSGSGSFVSDYNDIHATGGASVGYWSAARATLSAWQTASGKDAHSLSLDPLFGDVNGPDDLLGQYNGDDDDFHLKSTAGSWHGGAWTPDATNSPSIDAGYARSAFALEPPYNGLRVNQGAFGNTPQASKSVYGGEFHAVVFSANPTNGGALSVWPEAASYPTNVVVEATATPAAYFGWTNWSGSFWDTNRTLSFVVEADLALTANFIAACSNTNGVPDWWLAFYGLPVSQAGAGADSDGDRLLNWEEYIAGTAPGDPDSVFIVESVGSPAGAGHVISWHGVAGREYWVDGTTNLLAPFVNLTNRLPAVLPVNVYTDTTFSAGVTVYYRIGAALE